MLEELESLAGKLTELAGRVRLLQDENQQLRTQVASGKAELEELHQRVNAAGARIDALLERLPSALPAPALASTPSSIDKR